MLRSVLALSAICVSASTAFSQALMVQQAQPPRLVVVAQPQAQQQQPGMGGGFIEFLFGDRRSGSQVVMPRAVEQERPVYAHIDPAIGARPESMSHGLEVNPRYLRREVAFDGPEAPGSIVIDTPNKFLYLVQPGGRAIRYGIGVGRPGFTWAGSHKVTAKKEWPDWIPPEEMLQRQPDLPRFMPGGVENPLGARALYLGSTLYRIHGTNEAWTIGQNVSSGCIRMRNPDVIDLYERVKVGTKVVVL
jgi:lipoprotein-anchoring transpeptidase ErfK/SrfK